MKQNLYTCCRCGRQQRTAPDQQEAPLGWAEINVQRDWVATVEGEHQRTTLDTHACGECCGEVLEFLEKVVADRDATAPIDDRFDKGAS